MRFHQVQVDDEVFEFVKIEAEPLVDDFNSALRRLLFLANTQSKQHQVNLLAERHEKNSSLPTFPNGTPIALKRILEVMHLVHNGTYTRTAATNFLAKKHQVEPQTISDKYGRQLGLTANQFDRLMEEPNLDRLRNLLKTKFKKDSDVIDQFLK